MKMKSSTDTNGITGKTHTTMNFTKQHIGIGAGLILAGIFLGRVMFGGPADHNEHGHDHLSDTEIAQHIQEEHTDEDGSTIWTCSMHPSVREDEPGNCPICGMELVPVRSGTAEVHEDDYSMVMTEAAVQLADIQTAPVIRAVPRRELDLPGRIRVDERRITRVTTYFPGRIQNTIVNFTGTPIREGEPMVSIYSPELIAAQRELLEAARQKERNPRLYESARQKFRLWEFTDEQIDEIENSGIVRQELEIRSPVSGYVLSRNIADKQYVSEGTVIYEVANLDHIWVVLEAYEEDVQWLRVGDQFSFRARNNPGQQYQATVSWIDPVVDPGKRTVGIRADLANPENRLKPDMLVRGSLSAAMETEKLLVPVSSVLWTGPRSLVYIKDTAVDVPRFEVREVELGPRAGDYYVIEEGVEEGEEVVFHGNFRIDSEFQIADRFSMMNRDPGRGAVRIHDHGKMERDDHDHVEQTDHEHQRFEEVPDIFRANLTEAVEAYIRGKDALVESDLDAAVTEFAVFVEILNEIGEHDLSGDGHVAWMESWSALTDTATELIGAGDIDEARSSFRILSDELIAAVEMFGIDGVIYRQYCPMAFDDEGAYWISDEEQIQNPYLPETMPGCGEVIERFGT